MVGRLILLFVFLPLVELYLLLECARLTSPTLTMLLVVVTGITGYWLTRSQGLRTYQRIQDELRAGKVPTNALLDGMMIFLAGAFLLTPGIVTDLIGFSLLIPVTRGCYRHLILRWLKSRFSWQQVVGHPFQSSPFDLGNPPDGEVVDADDLGGTIDLRRIETRDAANDEEIAGQ
ncbi:MAG: FxsA family protein [Pirellulaceae bacterium]